MKILIVEGSEERRREMVEALCEVANVAVSGAVPDLRSALRAVCDASPDVIVTGIILPDGDGAQLIRRVRKLERAPSIVVVSSAGSDDQRMRYLAAGADQYVEHDPELRGLQDAVSTLFRRRAVGSIPPIDTVSLLGRMTAGIVHDLNNHLGAMQITLRMLRVHPAETDTLLAQVQASVDAMARMTTTLLGYARGHAPPPMWLDLGAVVRDTLAWLARIISPAVIISTEIGESLEVHGVRSELEQLVLNLVINACEALPKGGAVHVSVRHVPGAVMLEVSDTGTSGFVLGEHGTSMSTKRGGAGLGLGIVAAVVERHRGAYRIVPRASGGTLVSVMLPTT